MGRHHFPVSIFQFAVLLFTGHSCAAMITETNPRSGPSTFVTSMGDLRLEYLRTDVPTSRGRAELLSPAQSSYVQFQIARAIGGTILSTLKPQDFMV
jgi:hypothetical protein